MKKIAVMGHIDHGKTTLISAIGNAFNTEVKTVPNTLRTEANVNFGGEDYLFFDYPNDYGYLMNLDCTEDGVVLVIAGTDGAMDGTEEAMNICKNFGIDIIAVFFSKCDLVEYEEFLEMAEMDIKYCLECRGMDDKIPFIRGSANMNYSGWESKIKKLVEAVAESF